MLTKSEGNKAKYQATKVKHDTINGKVVTKFMIKIGVRGTDRETVSFFVTVFDDIALQDGDMVRFLDFDSIIPSYYAEKKKINWFITAIVEVVPPDTLQDKRKFNNPYAGQ
jgi:hypothetical protein